MEHVPQLCAAQSNRHNVHIQGDDYGSPGFVVELTKRRLVHAPQRLGIVKPYICQGLVRIWANLGRWKHSAVGLVKALGCFAIVTARAILGHLTRVPHEIARLSRRPNRLWGRNSTVR